MLYQMTTCKKVRIRALSYVEITQNNAACRHALSRLTPRELEICTLHFVEGHSQSQIAEWFGVTLRIVQRMVESAVAKVPALQPLRVKSRQKQKRPRIIAFSQLSSNDRQRGPFNPDEI
jgi:DNA-directed RNA polymerase specialized sigma24 family protein